MRKRLFCLLIIALPLMVSAGDAVVDGIKFTLDETNMTAEAAGLVDSTITDLVIPASIKVEEKEYQVVSVGYNAFMNNFFSSITFSEGLETIGAAAFQSCMSLREVTIPNSVKTLGEYSFAGCTYMNIITLGEGLITIESGAFHETGIEQMYIYAPRIPETFPDYSSFPDFTNWGMVMVHVPADLVDDYKNSDQPYWSSLCDDRIIALPDQRPIEVEVSGYRFWIDPASGTAELVKVLEDNTGMMVPASVEVEGEEYVVTSVGPLAFEHSNLPVVELPNSVVTIGERAFSLCSTTEIHFGEGIREIGDYLIANNPGATSIYIPAMEIPLAGKKSFNPTGDGHTNLTDLVKIYVPESLLDDYRNSTQEPWVSIKDENIVAIGSEDAIIDSKSVMVEKARFSLDGCRLQSPTKGINIIRMSDGTTKKVIVK